MPFPQMRGPFLRISMYLGERARIQVDADVDPFQSEGTRKNLHVGFCNYLNRVVGLLMIATSGTRKTPGFCDSLCGRR